MNIKQFIREELLEMDTIEPVDSSEQQLVMRCELCGDSSRDLNKKRFYIKISDNLNEPILYNCFNCGAKGILTPDVLRQIGYFPDLDIASDLMKFNSGTFKSFSGTKKKKGKLFIKIPDIQDTDLNRIKKKYIEDRLGIELSYEEMKEYKIICDFGNFIKFNHIEKWTRKKETMNILHNFYVGFLTINNELLNMRRINDDADLKRYENYRLFKSSEEIKRLYSIPSKVMPVTTEEVTINLAEGPFDILGIYHHIFNKCDRTNNVFIAICGDTYKNALELILSYGIVGDNVTLNIFSDKDRDISFYKNFLKIDFYKVWFKKINLYYNEKGKDYGVPKDKIELVKYSL